FPLQIPHSKLKQTPPNRERHALSYCPKRGCCMHRWIRVIGRFAGTAVIGFGMAASVKAQMPEKFTNLQYFPKDTKRDDLMQTRRGFSSSLGARCKYCHDTKDGAPPEKRDFASDAKDPKKIARAMLRMVDAINQEYIAKLGTQTQNRVSCVTC